LWSGRVRQVSNCPPIAWQTRDTVDFDRAASAPRASARVFSTSRADRPRTNPAITSDSSALLLVTVVPNSLDANASAVPRSFGRAIVTGPAVVLTVAGAVPVTRPRPGIHGGGRPLVAGPAQEGLHLGLQRRLDDQPGTQAGDVLDHLAQLTLPAEQGINLGTDLLGRRYSNRHGRSPSFAELVALEGTYVRCHLHQRRDTVRR
jgi:hypothetical protein